MKIPIADRKEVRMMDKQELLSKVYEVKKTVDVTEANRMLGNNHIMLAMYYPNQELTFVLGAIDWNRK